MSILQNFTLASLSLALTACATASTTTASFIQGSTTPVTPVAKMFSQSKSFASNGDLLFEQKLMAKNTAKLIEPFHHSVEKYSVEVDVTTSELLYKLSEVLGEGVQGYCTFRNVRKSKNLFGGDLNPSQSCFFDTSKDGNFDEIYFSFLKDSATLSQMSPSILTVELANDKNMKMKPIGYKSLGTNCRGKCRGRYTSRGINFGTSKA